MGLLDNDTVIVDAILTKAGRRKLAEGEPLGITQFAFGDTGVDYTLYNPNHPNGSSAYGTAITSLPQMEAVPHELVFMRSKLYGTGQRNVQSYAHVTLQNVAETIQKAEGTGQQNNQSIPIIIIPQVSDRLQEEGLEFTFRVLDARGLVVNGIENLPLFNSPDVAPLQVTGTQLEINARQAEITAQKVIGVEVRRAGAAPAFLSVTIEKNS